MRRILATFILVVALGLTLAGCGSAPAAVTESTTTSTTAAPTIDKAKFASTWAAYKAIESATMVGVTYSDFGPLVQKLLTEYSLIPKANLSTKETTDLNGLRQIILAYADSYTLWQQKLEANNRRMTIKIGDIESFDRAVEMAHTYAVATTVSTSYNPDTPAYTYISSNAFQVVWSWASTKGDALAADLAP